MDRITLNAYAKINLGLDVCGRLENGYHLVKMIMQSIDLYDTLIIEKQDATELTEDEKIMLTSDNKEVPCDKTNLIYKAARKMMDIYTIPGGVKIHLIKRIPVAAGMAGGSTDAAAVLKGMNQLFHLNASMEELMKLGVTMGADIPYCVMGGTALACGIGEILTTLPDMPQCFIVIAKPDISVSTKYVYEKLDAQKIMNHPDIDGIIEAISSSNIEKIVKKLGNVLEIVTEQEHSEVTIIKDCMNKQGALGALMSGSGPTVFGIFDTEEKAQETVDIIKSQQYAKQVYISKPINNR